MRRPFNRERCSISIKALSNAFSETKFGNIDFIEFLEGCFQEELITNKDSKEKFYLHREDFLREIIAEFENTDAFKWLSVMLSEKKFGYQAIDNKVFVVENPNVFSAI